MKPKCLLLTGALLLAVAPSVAAQDLESYAGVRFRFESAGARGAAMGGTTEAVSDTFSATSNPASLARIRERRLAIDARRGTDSTEFISGGTLGSFTTIRPETSSSGIRGAILVLPTSRATWAVYADEPLHATSPSAGLANGERAGVQLGVVNGRLVSLAECHTINGCGLAVFDTPIALRVDSRVTLRRVGTAVAFTAGSVSLGGAVQYARLDQRTTSAIHDHRAGDARTTWSAGAQWQISPTTRAGASYRSGARFDTTRIAAYPDFLEQEQAKFGTPSSYGAGVAFDVAPNVTVAFDAQRINYSEMLAGSQRAIHTTAGSHPLVMPDVTEYHAGAEYRLDTRVPVALRAGWWRDPSHRLRALERSTNDGGFVIPAAFFNLSLLDEDEDHLTAGIGIGERVRVDAAIDRSARTTRGSLTVATSF